MNAPSHSRACGYAAHDLGIDLSRSWLIGDILNDIETGRCAGCRTVLIDIGHETEWKWSPNREPHYRAADLTEAVRLIAASTHRRATSEPVRETR